MRRRRACWSPARGPRRACATRSPWLVVRGDRGGRRSRATFGAIALAQAAVRARRLPAFFAEQAKLGAVEAPASRSRGACPAAATQAQLAAMQLMIAQVLPSVFVLGAALSALLAVYAVGWVGRRGGAGAQGASRRWRELDLSWHLTWACHRRAGRPGGGALHGPDRTARSVRCRGTSSCSRAARCSCRASPSSRGCTARRSSARVGRTLGYVLLAITEVMTPIAGPDRARQHHGSGRPVDQHPQAPARGRAARRSRRGAADRV